MEFGPSFRETHTLPDGTRVVLRRIRPEDGAELRRGFDALSPESRYRRFFGPVSTLDDRTVDYLTCVDGFDHFALVALVESLDLKSERGVGVVRFVRFKDDPEVAELAVTVVDDMQNRGLGTLLTLTAVRAARERGIHRFRGEVLAANEHVVKALREAGAEEKGTGDETIAFEVDLGEGDEKMSVLRKLLRLTATQVNLILHRMLPVPWLPTR